MNSKTKFESDFMARYIAGKIDTEVTFDLFNKVEKNQQKPLQFSKEAKNVMEVGKKTVEILSRTAAQQRKCFFLRHS